MVFGETQGIKSDFYADNLFRLGGGYLINKDVQLDTAITLNTKNTPSVLSLNFGASYRLDRHKDKEQPNNGTSAKALDKRNSGSKKSRKKSRKKKNTNFDDD